MNRPRNEHRESRRPDGGTITIIAAALLTALMGMAALAVDLGFLYTRSRMMYAVADSAVWVGMKDLVAGKSNTQITTDINDMAGKYSGYTFTVPTPTTTTVTVKVEATYPLYFAKMLGFPSKKLTVQATGTKNASPPPILALGNTCGLGVNINGQGALQVDGSIESNASIIWGTGPPGPNILGNVTASAACGPVTLGNGAAATGSVGPGGPFTDPFSPYTLPTCTYGSVGADLGWLGPYWNSSTTPPTLAPGVYCSNGNLQVISPGPGTGFTALGVTLISIGGTVSIQAGDASTMTPNAASPNGIIAYSTANTGTAPGDIAITGPAGPTATFDMGGSFYAPFGTVNIQQNGPYKMGSVIANNVWIGDNGPWEIGVGSTGAPNAWQMSQ